MIDDTVNKFERHSPWFKRYMYGKEDPNKVTTMEDSPKKGKKKETSVETSVEEPKSSGLEEPKKHKRSASTYIRMIKKYDNDEFQSLSIDYDRAKRKDGYSGSFEDFVQEYLDDQDFEESGE